MDNDSLLTCFGGECKFVDVEKKKVGGYLVRFTSAEDPDLIGDFFTAETDFGLDEVGAKSVVLFDHGLDPKVGKKAIGRVDLKKDEFGIWAEGIIEQRDKYEKFIHGLVEDDKAGWSSGTLPNRVERERVGKSWWVKSWPLGLDATITHVPCESRNSVISLKRFSELRDNLIDELNGVERDERPDELKKVWTTKFINNLPDSSFAYIADGGTEDSEGKTTPRSLRHFPYKDAEGTIDKAHVRNALARIPQSKLSDEAKKKATAVIEKAAKKVGVEVAQAKSVSVKSIFSDSLAAQITPWSLMEAYRTTLSKIHDQHRAAQDLGQTVDTEAMVGEALAEFTTALHDWSTDQLTKMDDGEGMGYLLSLTASSASGMAALKARLNSTISLSDHSATVGATLEELTETARIAADIMKSLGARFEVRAEDRLKTNRPVAKRLVESVTKMLPQLEAAAAELQTCADEAKSLIHPETKDVKPSEVEPDMSAEAEQKLLSILELSTRAYAQV